LRIVKIMYFDEPAEAFDRTAGREVGAIMTVAGLFTLLFFIFPSPIVNAASRAAAVLFSAG
jgi:NADH-quinone oxidoreductase subunit N